MGGGMRTAEKVVGAGAARVVVGRLERDRRGKRTAFEVAAPSAADEAMPARVALTLALAHAIERALNAGEFRDQAAAARHLGVSRARVTQLLELTLLDPTMQETVLGMTKGGVGRVTERGLREICRRRWWGQ